MSAEDPETWDLSDTDKVKEPFINTLLPATGPDSAFILASKASGAGDVGSGGEDVASGGLGAPHTRAASADDDELLEWPCLGSEPSPQQGSWSP